jgi:hypothetical protein
MVKSTLRFLETCAGLIVLTVAFAVFTTVEFVMDLFLSEEDEDSLDF